MELRVENEANFAIVTQQLQKSFFYNVFFYNFIQSCDSRTIHYLTREFRVKLHLKTDIALIASRFVRYRFSRAI